MRALLWLIIFAILFYTSYEAVPIYYTGIYRIRTVCKENADTYHKYGRPYVVKRVGEGLDGLGIPRNKRTFSVDVTEESVIIRIIYKDQVTFLDRYTKNLTFDYECEGALKSIYD